MIKKTLIKLAHFRDNKLDSVKKNTKKLKRRKSRMKIKIQWKWVIGASILFLLFLIVVLPQVSTYSNEAIGVSESPDQSFTYSGAQLYELAKSYGEAGRRTYIKLRWTFDLI